MEQHQVPAHEEPTIVASKNKSLLSRNARWLLGGSLGVVLVAVGYIVYSMFINIEPDAASCTSRTLNVGASSTCVKYAQQMLNGISEYYSVIPSTSGTLSAASISSNGKYTSTTSSQVKAFQAYSNKTVTGIINKDTWVSLCAYTKSAYSSYSTNLRTSAIQSARTAYAKVSCPTASQDTEDTQDTVTSTSTSDALEDVDSTSTTTGDSTTVTTEDRDTSAEQAVNDISNTTQTPLTIVTWNIAGGSKNFNASARLQGLQKIDDSADIIGLQESHKADFRKLLRDQYLCNKCSDGNPSTMQGIQFENIPLGTDIYGTNNTPPASVPILWKRDRFTLEGYGAYTALAKVYNDESGNKVTRKWITWVRLYDKNTNKSFYTLNLHTPAGVESNGAPVKKMKKRNDTYKYEMQLIAKIVKNNFSAENLPIFIVGDFNVDYRSDKAVKYRYFPYVTMANLGFTSNWAYAETNGGLPSTGTGGSSRLIDYIFTKQDAGMSFDRTSISPDMYGSDHHPVSATVDIK
jgi:endonuclease/exonuclease/phosphatase family metal-dependent hydrolase